MSHLRWSVSRLPKMTGGGDILHMHVEGYNAGQLHAVVRIDGMSPAHLEEVIEHLNITMNAQLLELRRIKEKFA